MYASLANQSYHGLHYIIAFGVAFIVIPLYMFWPVVGTISDKFWANFMRMCLFVIIIGYILVVLKLMEFIGLAGAIAVWTTFRKRRDPTGRVVSGYATAIFYDIIESPYMIRQAIRNTFEWIRGRAPRPRYFRRVTLHRPTFNLSFLFALILLCVLFISLYVRIANAMENAAPAMSDGYVTLAWLKYVNERILFHDGIYPQGYYFVMDVLEKFSFINPLYIVKYSGPFMSTIATFGFYYVITRLSKNGHFGGIVAAVVFGIFGWTLFQQDWVRQAATNSQEFGFVFVLPTAYFFYRYVRQGEKTDIATALAGLSVTGMVHTLAYLLTFLGALSAIVAAVVMSETIAWKRVWRSVGAFVLSGLLSIAPLLLGLAYGRKLNSSAEQYAASTVASTFFPHMKLLSIGFAGVFSFSLLILLTFVERLRGNRYPEWLFAGLFGLSMFFVFYYGGALTKSEVLVARTRDLWAVVAPFSIGMACNALIHYLPLSKVRIRIVESCLLCLGIGLPVVAAKPVPINPYKLQWNSDVTEYLQINRKYQYTGYMLVAPNEEYSLVLGTGYRMSQAAFVKTYNPVKPPLTRYGAAHFDSGISHDVFIYDFKHIFEVSKSNNVYSLEAPLYAQERKNRVVLNAWIAKYRAAHHGIDVYYNGPNLTIYHIHVVVPKQ